MTKYLLLLSILLSTGCAHRTVLRDAQVYRAELEQYDRWATEQAKHLRAFIEQHCECDEGPEGDPFKTAECEEAADLVLTIEARHDWHKQMSLWNAGLLKDEPAASPPDILPLSCPLMGGEDE